METVGERLKRLRMRAGITQRQLATHSVSYPYVSRIEAGERIPSRRALAEVAERLTYFIGKRVSALYLEEGPGDERECPHCGSHVDIKEV